MKIPTVWTWVGASSVENIMFSSQTSCHEHVPFPIEKNRSTHANSWFSPPMLGNQKLEYVKKDVNVPVTIHFSIVSPTHFERTATRKTLPLEDIEEPHPQRCSPGFTCNEHTHRIHGAIVSYLSNNIKSQWDVGKYTIHGWYGIYSSGKCKVGWNSFLVSFCDGISADFSGDGGSVSFRGVYFRVMKMRNVHVQNDGKV